ncbi:tRNA pseudouridine(55) synthase TruB [Neorhodopirellula pilleata]|uniref:tRNA pseudouridine synthase B n=1 Tax=Neorhodopirellula pilleata TaxID=2714738 RepID=A0A5C6AQA4_9BACT|nr:tRNA pseudouridine(55) synthase TruB [Neorhodopirellula pilleata]TWU01900.1 tRNA pseudouridine synthase B [Neorhodopirellula pilleata]
MNTLIDHGIPALKHSFGFLPFNKPKGMTSRDLANRVQRRLRRETENRALKVGHTGTLDPLAQGLVVLAVGAATRLTPWMLRPTKRYLAMFRLGAYSESGDLEEPVIELPDPCIPTRDQIEQSLKQFHGWIDQTPPTHSAIWVGGERAHERIRRGEAIEMPTRRVWIGSIELVRYEYPMIELDVVCGSGTYLRSLGIDLGIACGTVAVMTDLSRTAAGNFDLESAIDCVPPNDPPPMDGKSTRYGLTPMMNLGRKAVLMNDSLSLVDGSQVNETQVNETQTAASPWLIDYLVPPMMALGHMAQLRLDAVDAQRVRNGLFVEGDADPPLHTQVPPPDPITIDRPDASPIPAEILTVDPRGELVAIMRRKRNQWAPFRVFAPTTATSGV